jgi:RNA polymerase primary sigma factor
VPAHINDKLQRIASIARTFETAARREPTLDELAERVEIPSQKLAALLSITLDPFYIDEKTIDDMIARDVRDDYVAPDPVDLVEQNQMNRAVNTFVSSLSTKNRQEERVLRMRFGIGVQEALTLDEICTRLSLTRERIRQIESKALRKLRRPELAEHVKRTVYNFESEERFPLQEAKEPEVIDAIHTANEALEHQAQKSSVEAQVPQLRRPSNQSKLTALDRLLEKAAELGVSVEDGRQNPTKCIWVRLLATPDAQHRALARKLFEFGFEYSQGRGYWK